MIRKRNKILNTWATTEARVVELLSTREKRKTDQDGYDDIYYIYEYKISYMANGAIIENKMECNWQPSIGHTFSIKFDPSSPKKYEINVDISIGFIGGAVVAFIFAAFLVYFGIYLMN
jgi:preprotein translocase subunit SecB